VQKVTHKRVLITVLTALVLAAPAFAWHDLDEVEGPGWDLPDGFPVMDGSYVMNVGELHLNITNHGLIGAWSGATCSLCDAPSAQWPAGSGVDYLWSAGLWVGATMLGEALVSTGQPEREFRPLDDIEATIYEAKSNILTRPTGNTEAGGKRLPDSEADDDDDGLIDEEILDGYDDDGDGLIDEDFGQVGNQMMVATMYDNTALANEIYADHEPLQLKLVQTSFAWENDNADDFVGFDFKITNIGVAAIENVYLGFFADSDIGSRNQQGKAEDDMAGFWEGMVRAKDNSYVPISVGYMYDDDGDGGAATGYFGILFLGHDTDPSGRTAPTSVRLRSFNHFSGQAAFDNGGDPTNDAERYELLSGVEFDQDVLDGKENDYRFLVSAGPFSELEKDATLEFQAAMVIGPGLEGLKTNAAEAALTWYGNFWNLDSDPETGVLGRETKICVDDFAGSGGQNPIFQFVADYIDTTCMTQEFLLSQPFISQDQLDDDGCIYVNMDNCFECSRVVGEICDKENMYIDNGWNCNQVNSSPGCTGVQGAETVIHWLVGMAPPPPGMRLWPTDNAVHVYWNNTSQITADIRTNLIDFESYRIWRADNWDRPYGSTLENGPESGLWQLIEEYDEINTYISTNVIGNDTLYDTLSLGRNTGFADIEYVPVCFSNPRFADLKEAMQMVVDADSLDTMKTLPALYDRQGRPVENLRPLLPWQGYAAELDTFFMAASREVTGPTTIEKVGQQFYEFVDTDVHNGFLYFYSVTATDHKMGPAPGTGEFVPTGDGLKGDPGSSFTHTHPATTAQTAEERLRDGVAIYVYPNPATRSALEEFQQLSPDADDPTGIKIRFTNLPESHNTINIYTLDGDLVQTLEHDGTTGYGEISWNLVSRNGQEIVSGIYLYVVKSRDAIFEDYIGKFVVIR
jgi:hypothetical protein